MTAIVDRLTATPARWATRVAWITLPLTVGAVIDDALADADTSARWIVACLAWAGWTLVLVGMLVRRPWGLTAARIVGPAPLLAAAAAALASNTSWVALAHGAVVVALLLLPETGADLVDGLSYGDERRPMLRPPFALYLGPIPLAWVIALGGATVGPLLLAADRVVLGIIVTALGVPATFAAVRSLHQLSRRWVVFVPNGFVIHDLLAAREPFLLRRQDVTSIGPASAEVDLDDERLVDVSQHATGVVLQVDLNGDIEIVPRSRGVSEVRVVERVLFTPTRPGAVLAEARSRRIPR